MVDGIIEHGMHKGYLSTVYGWQRHIKSLFTFKNGKNYNTPKLNELANTSSWSRNFKKALIDLTDANFEVCALVHDAVLIQIPIPNILND